MANHILRRGRVIITHIVNLAGVGVGDGCGEGGGDILHMNAAKHLIVFDNSSGRAIANLGKRAAPGAINARKPEDMHRQTVSFVQRHPLRLGLYPVVAPRGRRGECGALVNPCAAMVSIHSGCRKIAEPFRLGGQNIGL